MNADKYDLERAISLASLSDAQIQKLIDDQPEWASAKGAVDDWLPFHLRLQTVSVRAKSNLGYWQATSVEIPLGSVFWVHHPDGNCSINYNGYYVNPYGAKLDTGAYEQSPDGTSFLVAKVNKFAFFTRFLNKNVAVDQNIGYGAGSAAVKEPNWFWLTNQNFYGKMLVAINDDYFGDNGGEVTAIVEYGPAKQFFKLVQQARAEKKAQKK